jgi:tetratricopeptide (TPR) repeat protein
MNYLFLWINVFILYVYTLFPTIAAYRDSGEMVTVSKLLSIAHPPGYPLYILLSNIFIKILPMGNYAYRLNIFSALISSFCAVIVYRLLKKMFFDSCEKNFFKEVIVYFITLIFAINYLQWYLSLVSEMYTLNIFFVVLIIYLSYIILIEKKLNFSYLLFFIFSFALTNRLDIILIFPFIFFVFLEILKNSKFKFKTLSFIIFTIFLGLSVYLYLIIRSSTVPIINWNDPSKLKNFFSSLTRKTHGSTLDLLSTNYLPGENFVSGIDLYFKYLMSNYTVVGIVIILFGIIFLYLQNKTFFFSTTVSWITSCIWFIYKANLPPNPHAMAILEAHFLLPNVFMFIFFVYGIKYFFYKKLAYTKFLTLVFLCITIFYNLIFSFYKLNKRENYFAYDYTKNLLHCVQKNSLVVVREDVQLFSLWYETLVCKNRDDIIFIGQGLSGSRWYKDVYRQKNFYLMRIDKDNVENFIKENVMLGYKIYFTYDVDIDFGNLKEYVVEPNGLCLEVLPKNENKENYSQFLFDEIMFYRNDYVYDLEKDFFSSDLIEDYAKSRHNFGNYLMMKNYDTRAIEEFKKSMMLNIDYPVNYFYIAYIYFKNKNYELAKKFYDLAVKKYELYYNLAIKYNALKDVIENFKTQLATAYLHLGVVNEKLGNLDFSIKNYLEAINLKNDFSQAYYNLGVIYWHKGDWEKVVHYFKQTLYYDPNNLEARYYLEKIKSNVKK